MIPNDANRKSLNDVIEKLKKGHISIDCCFIHTLTILRTWEGIPFKQKSIYRHTESYLLTINAGAYMHFPRCIPALTPVANEERTGLIRG
jgi:hypothetical protein